MMSLKFKCITTLVFLILNQYVLSLSARLNIERGDQDVFDNPNCKNPTGVGCNCNGLNANCVNNACKRCRCSSTYKTFLSSNDNNGQCVKDRRLLFISNSSSFFIQNRDCIRPAYPSAYYVIKTDCDETDSRQRWIWTRNNQLMNVDTLKCLQEGPFSFTGGTSKNSYYDLVLVECNSAEIKQLWQCLGQNNVNFQSKTSKLNMFQFTRGYGKFIYIYGSNGNYFNERIKWKRFPSNESLCSEAFGCYEFVKDSSAIFVKDVRKCSQQCMEDKEISVPHKSGENLCFVMWKKLQYLDNDEWKQLLFRDEIFSIEKRMIKTFLKLNFTKATNDWTGLIVKLNFYCAGGKLAQVNIMNTKCVVIKFKGTAFYPPTVPPMFPKTQEVTRTLSTKDSSTAPSTVTATEVSTVTDTMSNTTGAAEKYKSDSLPVVIIIVVCVVITIFILCGILGFIFYRRRRRSECKTRSDNADVRSRDACADHFVTFRTSAMSDNSNYAIPYVKNTESPDHAGASTLVEDKELVDQVSLDQAETSTAIPRHDKDFEDEFGYVIPFAIQMTLGDQIVSSGSVPDQQYLEERLPSDSDAADSIKNEGGYEPLGERYDHVYQALLPSTSR